MFALAGMVGALVATPRGRLGVFAVAEPHRALRHWTVLWSADRLRTLGFKTSLALLGSIGSGPQSEQVIATKRKEKT